MALSACTRSQLKALFVGTLDSAGTVLDEIDFRDMALPGGSRLKPKELFSGDYRCATTMTITATHLS